MLQQLGIDVLYVVTGQRTPEVASSFNGDDIDLVEHYRQLPEGDRQNAHKMTTTLAAMTKSSWLGLYTSMEMWRLLFR